MLQNTFNESIIMERIKILGKDSKARFLKGRVKIPNQHLSYKFSIRAKESFPWYFDEGFKVKVNCVLIKGENDNEILLSYQFGVSKVARAVHE